MALEALKRKMVFSGGAGVFVEFFLSDWKALARMNRGSYEVWGFFGDFVVFFLGFRVV
jgi:hypothetical protein